MQRESLKFFSLELAYSSRTTQSVSHHSYRIVNGVGFLELTWTGHLSLFTSIDYWTIFITIDHYACYKCIISPIDNVTVATVISHKSEKQSNRKYQTSPTVCNPSSHFAADNRLVRRLQSSAPVLLCVAAWNSPIGNY